MPEALVTPDDSMTANGSMSASSAASDDGGDGLVVAAAADAAGGLVPSPTLDDAAADNFIINRWAIARKAVLKAPPKTGWNALFGAGDGHVGGLVGAIKQAGRTNTLRRAALKIRALRSFMKPTESSAANAIEGGERTAVVSSTSAEVVPATKTEAEIAAEYAKRRAVFAPSHKTGWRGTGYCGEVVNGIFEDKQSLTKRKMTRLLPEVVALVERAWEACEPIQGRIHLKKYMDYHLCCYYYIAGVEGDAVDLIEAFDSAVMDWVGDTEDSLSQVGRRELHFELFRDSIFELIDLYTPTTDWKQYLGYLKVLVRAISVERDGKPRLRHSWSALGKAGAGGGGLGGGGGGKQLASAVTAIVRARWSEEEDVGREEQEARCAAVFQGWLDDQKAKAEEEEDDKEETKLPADKLTLHGFLEALWQLPSLSVPSAESVDGARRISDAFRRFDTSASGLLCLADFTSVVLDDAPSGWLPETKSSKMNLALAGRRLTAVARLGNMRILPSAETGEGGEGGAAAVRSSSCPPIRSGAVASPSDQVGAAPEAAATRPGLISPTPPPVRKAASGKGVSSAKATSKGVSKDKLRKAGKLVMIATTTPSKISKVAAVD